MVSSSPLHPVLNHIVEIFGLQANQRVDSHERIGHVRITAWIGIVVGSMFSGFNMLLPGMWVLGLVELAAVLFLLLPAALLVRHEAQVGVAELMLLAAASVILGALVYFGGIEGTGLFWISTMPFLLFFLKGQRQGCWYCLGFTVLVGVIMAYSEPSRAMAYNYSPVVKVQFLISLCFYTLLAAHFNMLRSRFEDKLAQRVEEKTADAKNLLSQMQYLATHDALTGLPNRTQLLELLQQEIKAAQIAGRRFAVCTLRLERLFELSNVLGIAGADSVVKQVAAHIAHITEGHGLLARGRRDEFTITWRLDQAAMDAEVLGRLLAQRQISVEEQGMSLYIELSVGLAIYPDHSSDEDLLLKKAEQALLQARQQAQRWSIYDEQQEQIVTTHPLTADK